MLRRILNGMHLHHRIERGGDLRLRGLIRFGGLALGLASAAASLSAGDRAGGGESFRLLALDGRAAVRWRVPAQGLPAAVTYAFVTESRSFPGARNCDAMQPPSAALTRSGIAEEDFRREVRAAFDLWEKAADIRFQETASTADAGILIGADAKTRGRAFTNVTLADSVPAGPQRGGDVGAIRQALICLNPAQPWKIGFDGDLAVYDLRFTMTHEIGHAIGLDHPGPEGQLMSFRYVERSRELQAGDLAGAAALYGRNGAPPNVETRLGAAEKLKDPAKEAGSSLGLSEAPAR